MTGAVLKEPLCSRDFSRILLVKPSSLGDIVHAIPVLRGLRKRYPNARIDWLIGSAFAALLDQDRDLNELIRFDRRRFARMNRDPRVALEFIRFLKALRGRHYDLVIDLQGLFRSGFLTRATGAKVRIGFSDAREGAPCFYTHRIPAATMPAHAVDRNYEVARLLGFGHLPLDFSLPIGPEARSKASRVLDEAGITRHIPLIAVVPGARWETKVWPAPCFSQAIDMLQDGLNVRCVLLGGPEDVDACRVIAQTCRTVVATLAGQTTVPQLAAILERADVVLCHDSAPMHIAAALGRPLVCLIGPTHPLRTGPYRRVDDVLRVPLPCSPCYLRKLSQCRHGHRCMHELRVDLVVSRLKHVLNGLSTVDVVLPACRT